MARKMEPGTVLILLYRNPLSDEEIRLYTKDARVKYKDAFDDMFLFARQMAKTSSPAPEQTVFIIRK